MAPLHSPLDANQLHSLRAIHASAPDSPRHMLLVRACAQMNRNACPHPELGHYQVRQRMCFGRAMAVGHSCHSAGITGSQSQQGFPWTVRQPLGTAITERPRMPFPCMQVCLVPRFSCSRRGADPVHYPPLRPMDHRSLPASQPFLSFDRKILHHSYGYTNCSTTAGFSGRCRAGRGASSSQARRRQAGQASWRSLQLVH